MNHKEKEGHLFLEKLSDFGIKLGLDKIRYLLKRLGNPEKAYRSVLIAGTNGKGSVAKFLATVLQESGYTTALYTSPHLVDVEERIQVNGCNIPAQEFDKLCLELKAVIAKFPLHYQPTYFEALTGLAFAYFERKKVDFLVCEVGMGGRFDATNVLAPELEIITPVSFDHMEFLGTSIEAIAAEKAGIIKEKSTVISGRQKKEAATVIERTARLKKAALIRYPRDFSYRTVSASFSDGQLFHFYGRRSCLRNMKTCLLGRYQVHNAAVALAAIEALDGKGIRVPESAVRSGIERARWPARFQALSYNPPVILDGAHNPAGTSTLLSTLTSYFPDTRYVFLVGILKDKQYRKMLELLAAHSELMIFTKPDNPRACSPEELAEVLSEIAPGIPFEIHQSPSGALSRLMSIKGNNPKVICGSLYLAGDILKEAGNLL